MCKKVYPCDHEPFVCPFDATNGSTCINICGLGVDDDIGESDEYW